MRPKTDPEKLKIPAFMRNKAIVTASRQKLLWTAWDRKDAGVKPNSKQATARISKTPRTISNEIQAPAPTPTKIKSVTPIDPSSIKPRKLACAGETTHFLDNISVAIIKTTVPLKVNDILLIEGGKYLFIQPITEMQIDRKPVKSAKKGSHIGLKVAFEAEINGSVYKLS